MARRKCIRCEIIYNLSYFREINNEHICDFCSTKKEKAKADKNT